jgi:cytochrome-b5 reductase
MGIPVTAYVMVSGLNSGDASAYTPITTDDQPGYFELLVKGYPNGNVSKYLCTLKEGDEVSVKGPVAKLPYTANMKKRIGMIAGGSGITPMLQIVKEILKNPDDKTEVTLIFGNQTPQDILMRAELDELAASSKGQVKIHYAVDKNPTNDANIQHIGYVTEQFCRQVLPSPSPDTLIYICGPKEMLDAVAGPKGFVQGRKFGQGHIGGILKELGYSIDMVFKF